MLTKNEIKRVMDLIKDGESDYKIGKILKHSPNTIKKIRETSIINEEKLITDGNFSHKDTPEVLRKFEHDFDKLIRDGDLNVEEIKFLEKRLNHLREILRVEVDEKIKIEVEDAVKSNNSQWRSYISENYVSKETETKLNNKIEEYKEQNSDLLNKNEKLNNNILDIINKKSKIISNLQRDYQHQQNQISNLSRDNNYFKTENERLNNSFSILKYYIDDKRSNLNFLTETLEIKEELLNKKEKKTKDELGEIKSKFDRKLNDFKIQRGEFYKKKDAFNKEEKRKNEEFNEEKRKIEIEQSQIKKDREYIEKTREQQKYERESLDKLQNYLMNTDSFNKFSIKCKNCIDPMIFDATDPEINKKLNVLFGNYVHPWCINRKKLVRVDSYPISERGTTPVLQSGLSTNIQSNKISASVVSSSTPVMCSGLSI